MKKNDTTFHTRRLDRPGWGLCIPVLFIAFVTPLARSAAGQTSPATAPAGAAQTRPFDAADHVVPAAISPRANIVLANLLRECPIMNGQWDRRRGDPGCVELYSTLFGYSAGLSRGRADLVAIGQASAGTEFNRLLKLAGNMLVGSSNLDLDELAGAPAIAVAGMRGGNQAQYKLFMTTLDYVLGRFDDGALDDVQQVGIAYLLAEAYRHDPRHKPMWIERARKLASRVSSPQADGRQHSPISFAAFASAAVARASGDTADLETARRLVLAAAPKFRTVEGRVRLEGPYSDYLSLHLTLADACCDLASIDADPRWRRMAVQLVDYAFSDTYFNDEFLAHDIQDDGSQSPTFCTGCNYHALYLADRVYGTTLKLNVVPPVRIIRGPIKIIHARYGEEDRWADVTAAVAERVAGERFRMRANTVLGEPALDDRRTLIVDFEIAGERHTKSAWGSDYLTIP